MGANHRSPRLFITEMADYTDVPVVARSEDRASLRFQHHHRDSMPCHLRDAPIHSSDAGRVAIRDEHLSTHRHSYNMEVLSRRASSDV
jgi:hypothetical protein